MKGISSLVAAGILFGSHLLAAPAALAAEAVTYLFPAPPSLPAFGPIRLAHQVVALPQAAHR